MSMKSNSKENSLFLVTNGANCNEKDIHFSYVPMEYLQCILQ